MDKQIAIRRLTGAIGAEVNGVNLKQPLDEKTFATIHQAFLAIAYCCSGGSFSTRRHKPLSATFGGQCSIRRPDAKTCT